MLSDGAKVPRVASGLKRTRGAASQKFTRRPPNEREQARREAFSREWAAYNAEAAKRLRSRGR